MPSWFVKSTNTDFDIRLETFFLRPRPTSEDKGRIISSMICLGNYMEHSIIVFCGEKNTSRCQLVEWASCVCALSLLPFWTWRIPNLARAYM